MHKSLLFRFFILLLFSLLFFGCVSTEYSHKQYPNGNADVVQTTDTNGFTTYFNTIYPKSDTNQPNAQAKYLLNLSNQMCANYKDTDCIYKDGKVILKKSYTASNAFYKFEEKDDLLSKKYRLTIDELPNVGTYNQNAYNIYSSYSDSFAKLSGKMNLSDPASKGAATLLATYGVQMSYSIQMPGNIISADGALNVTGNTASYDLIKQMKNNTPIVVVSEDINVVLYAVIGLVIMICILIFIAILTRPKVPQTFEPSKEVKL